MKHTIAADEPQAKRRRQSIITADTSNPLGEDGLSQCFRTVKITMYVAIAPVFSNEPLAGVKKENLDPLIMRFFEPANGVVVGYSDTQILGQDESGEGPKVAKIHTESPFAYTWVSTNLLVWSPSVGDTLDGYISASSTGHIALLVHDTFNATIKRDDIPSNWTFVASEQDDEISSGGWTDETGEWIDGKLRFTVKSFNTAGRTAHIVGSLLTVADVDRVMKRPKEPKSTKEHKAKEADQESAIDDDVPAYADESE